MASGPLVVRFITEPVQYHPGQPRDKEDSKRLRTHIAEVRRRKKLQVLPNPQRAIHHDDPTPDEKFCSCTLLKDSPRTKLLDDTTNDVSRAVKKQRAIADGYKICQLCRKLQFSELSWSGQLKAARARVPSVTPWLEAEFDPFESLPELQSYKHSTASRRAFNELKAHMVSFLSCDLLRTQVLPAAAKEPALFMALMYSSCAYLNGMKGGGETQLSMAIKSEAMRHINLRLDDPEKQNTSTTVASIEYLSSGVHVYGSATSRQESSAHEHGMMAILGKGMNFVVPEKDSFGKALTLCFILHQFTRSAVLGIPVAEYFINLFPRMTAVITDSDLFLLESPLFCPRSDFFTLMKLQKCSKHTLQLLRLAGQLIDGTLGDLAHFDYEAIRTKLMSMPSASDNTQPINAVRGDYIYESCRLAAILMLEAVDLQTAFINLNTPTLMLLKQAMQKTDIGSFWGPMAGVLFWVSMVGSAIAIGKPQHSFMSSLVARADHEMAYRDAFFDGSAMAAYRLQCFHLLLSDEGKRLARSR